MLTVALRSRMGRALTTSSAIAVLGWWGFPRSPLSSEDSALFRSAPKGRQQMGETGFCKNLRFSAVSCENLRFPAVFCANLRLPNPLIYRASRISVKICKNLQKCAFQVRFLPFAVSLLARPDFLSLEKKGAIQF